jgi:hypothetical protein
MLMMPHIHLLVYHHALALVHILLLKLAKKSILQQGSLLDRFNDVVAQAPVPYFLIVMEIQTSMSLKIAPRSGQIINDLSGQCHPLESKTCPRECTTQGFASDQMAPGENLCLHILLHAACAEGYV